jgi:murein DD-endopeptidase MepM/ murein hydrolase activator NlpD
MEKLLGALTQQRNRLACTPSIRPAKGWISSQFGYRTSPFTGRREFHSGIDIANNHGTSIIATADGVVSFVGKKHLLGNLVVIDHGHGLVTRFAHLDDALVKRGEKVKRGAVIAKMGNTGRSTGPHLHYEVRLNGLPVNPVQYILN